MGIFGLSPFSKKKDASKDKKADEKDVKAQEMDKSQKKDAQTCEFC